MSLDKNMNDELKKAMLAKNEPKLRTLRSIKAAFLMTKTEKGGTGEISEEQELKVLQKLYNQRKESFEIFEKGGRTELAQKEKEEMDIIYSFLPAQLDDASLIQIIKEIIVETGATSMKDMGKVVSAANAKLAGKADGKRISTIVKDLISQ
ncbi:MAG: GatB/YqeY domain-containing protein [Bacteroidetes bacterium]|jgi:uncharacterized protein YqeY|nr:GatB/YqeY domain-containing protein [Bacteroidota bacterium]MBP7255584.1 GatB/YqeY domain-containing protein [Chitinophagales bacterium]MBK7138188.1 GatB/YqeY domain-containing protein [Bacteroidota bacterium]MBK7504195.1 GatB/YqeY domain-containing protein [Bacteroidota bacterium]MBK7641138.1 GatB/YqeY domain-containing protein [Bacteroidota bacterium]